MVVQKQVYGLCCVGTKRGFSTIRNCEVDTYILYKKILHFLDSVKFVFFQLPLANATITGSAEKLRITFHCIQCSQASLSYRQYVCCVFCTCQYDIVNKHYSILRQLIPGRVISLSPRQRASFFSSLTSCKCRQPLAWTSSYRIFVG